ncbi:MAG: hypothetical protein A2W80_12215 [Candidatus Riflebacteria bacterium GWC2_50_8]|nr:MAG: hypothetical protein A2W80_12215 [Candidatus Riflebacteria bacterium GWC2_50_8]
MASLYAIIADQSNGEFLTILFLGLIFLAVVLYKYDIIEKRQLRPTGLDKALIYSSAGIALFCGILLFGKLLFPDNVDSLLQLLGLRDALKSATLSFQTLVLGVMSLLI